MARPPSPDGYPTLCLALLTEGPAHGYDLVQRLRDRTGGEMTLPAGLVYPILHALEEQGLVQAVWEPGERDRRKRRYTLTTQGRTVLADRTNRWEVHRRSVDRVLFGTIREVGQHG